MESYNFCLFVVGIFTYHNVFKDRPCCRMYHNLIPFWGWRILSCMYTCHFVYVCIIEGPLLSSSVCYERCCCERGCLVPVWVPAFDSLGYTPSGIAEWCGGSGQSFQEPPCWLPQRLHHLTFPAAVHKGSNFSTFLPTLVKFCFSEIIATLMRAKCYLICRYIISHG